MPPSCLFHTRPRYPLQLVQAWCRNHACNIKILSSPNGALLLAQRTPLNVILIPIDIHILKLLFCTLFCTIPFCILYLHVCPTPHASPCAQRVLGEGEVDENVLYYYLLYVCMYAQRLMPYPVLKGSWGKGRLIKGLSWKPQPASTDKRTYKGSMIKRGPHSNNSCILWKHMFHGIFNCLYFASENMSKGEV